MSSMEGAGSPAAIPSLEMGYPGCGRNAGSAWLLLSQAGPFPYFNSLRMETSGLRVEAHGPSCRAPGSSPVPVKQLEVCGMSDLQVKH